MSKTRQLATGPTTAKRPTHEAARSRSFVLGRRAFAKVSAVEGIHVTSDMEADFRSLDELSLVARRKALAEKYGKA